MAKRSIIEIDVNDERWQKFLESFKGYEEAVAGMPEEWKTIAGAMGAAGGAFDKTSMAAMKSLEKAAGYIGDMASHLHQAEKGMKDFGKQTSTSGSGLKRLLHDARAFSHTIRDIGGGLLKLASIGIGATLAGALGMMGLGEAAYRRERTARGLSLSAGQVASFETHMMPYVEPGFLEKAANAKVDMTQWPWLSAMGISPMQVQTENAEKLSFQMIESARRIWKTGPQTQQWAAAHGLTRFFSMNELRRLGNTPLDVLRRDEILARKDAGVLGFSHQTGQEYTDFMVTLKKAGIEIESVLIRKLAPLAKPLGQLGITLANLFAKGLDSAAFRRLMKELPGDIKAMTRYLAGPDFAHLMNRFGGAILDVTNAILWLAKEIKEIPSLIPDEYRQAEKKYPFLHMDFNRKDWIKVLPDLGYLLSGRLFGEDPLKAYPATAGEQSRMTTKPSAHHPLAFKIVPPVGHSVERGVNGLAH